MAMMRNTARIGAAVFALGLMAGPQAPGLAAADNPDADSPVASKAQAQTRSERTGRDDSARTAGAVRAPAAARAVRAAPRASAAGSPTPGVEAVRARVSAPPNAAARRAPGAPRPDTARAPAASPVPPAAQAASAAIAAGATTAATTTTTTTATATTVIQGIVNALADTLAGWLSSLPPNPLTGLLEGALLLLRRTFSPEGPGADPDPVVAPADPATPSITIHNNTASTLWVYNLPNSGDYSIPSDFQPVSISQGLSAPVTLALGTGPVGAPKNRIYLVEGTTGFTLPVVATSGVDAFDPTAPSADNSFANYSFLEYFLYPTATGNQYTIDVSYIDEWSLPVQTQFTINSAAWTGAVDGKIYGFKDFDTVTGQLGATGAEPYGDLVWSGQSPFGPQPPESVSRVIGPNKVWTAQFEINEFGAAATNWNMNTAGWVPTSYQNFVQYNNPPFPPCSSGCQFTDYPYAFNGSGVSGSATETNFDFWKNEVSAPGSTPYPTALRTAAILDGFTTANANGVYGFFTYPNDETAGQYTNIPTAVSLDMYVYGAADGLSDSVIPGGAWSYSTSVANSGTGPRIKNVRGTLNGTAATDTFILDYPFTSPAYAPRVEAVAEHNDIIVIARQTLGATSTTIDVVDRAWFLGGGLGNTRSQFVYEQSTGNLYFDATPSLPGYSGVLANLRGIADPTSLLSVL